MIAKVITSGESREAAFARATLALKDFDILGLQHNIGFLIALLSDKRVLACDTHTRFIEEHIEDFVPGYTEDRLHALVALAAQASLSPSSISPSSISPSSISPDPFNTLGRVPF